ncbi:MAG: T9SS type A sorting domain-containing protein, partial [Bacteroidia bacterium]|nr:T9SS type A sorting domain-containing protein [Bacteroidia bacterium]
ASSVVISPTGGYTLLGRSIGVGAGSWDMVLLHTDTSGNLQWEKAYGFSQTEYPYSLIVTNDGGYALSGESFNNGFGQSDLYFVKTDDQGLNGCYTDSSLSENPAATVFYAYAPVVTTGVIPINVVTSAGMGGGASARYCSVGLEEGTQNGLRLYPNPFSDALHLELTTVCPELSITIRNTMGQTIDRQNFRNTSVVRLHFEAAPGLYLVETDTGEKGKIQSRVIKY